MRNSICNDSNNLGAVVADANHEEITKILRKLKRKPIRHSDIPDEYKNNISIVKKERELGIRETRTKGYDIINKHFFVEEFLDGSEHIISFENFSSFYDFLQGDIYENACYYGYEFTQEEIVAYSIHTDKLNFVSLIDYDIDQENAHFTESALSYSMIKRYDRRKHIFIVEGITVKDSNGNVLNKYKKEFQFFFDFARFLKKDFSDADLLFCNGLGNVKDLKNFNLKNAMLAPNVCEQFGIECECFNFCQDKPNPIILENELSYANELSCINESSCLMEVGMSYEEMIKYQKIFYISDLHINYQLWKKNCKTINTVIIEIQRIVDEMLSDKMVNGVILFGGDIASDFSIFKLFIKILRASLDEKHINCKVIFTLGNHELRGFEGKELKAIIEIYKNFLTDNKMYLIQNNILFQCFDKKMQEIETDELENISKEELLNKLKRAELIIFGGIGFAAYNNMFNANNNIYQSTISRQQEIEEGKAFENLYNKVCEFLSERKVVILTHMPLKDWSKSNVGQANFNYVNGHTHKNCFYDDGSYSIFADNQIGYTDRKVKLKYFWLERDFDIFINYKDGIYEITREEYRDFCVGKRIEITFNRKFQRIYMLKKKGYYMFILQSENGNLNILNGGNIKNLSNKSISYYFDNMDKVVAYIETPFNKYSDFQKEISKVIKEIGGYGTIHGAIIDIDIFNHIFVNPNDLKITAYWADDIVSKKVYRDLPTLLEENCPDIHANYLKKIEGKATATHAVLKRSEIEGSKRVISYTKTDIYSVSREIKKMQKLNSNILSIWEDLNSEIESDKTLAEIKRIN